MPSVQLPRPIEVKLAVIGDVKCGKSCLIKRFCEKRYTEKYFPTIGIDFGIKRTSIRNKQLKVNVFDMAGDMVYYEVRNEFYTAVCGILLVFDVTRQNSFRSLGRWLKELKTEAGIHVSEIAVCVCGNKTDQFPREVSYFEASQWCARRNIPYFETSALTGHGVDEAIHTLLESIVEPNAEATWTQQNGARHWWEMPEKESSDAHSNKASSKSHSTMRSPHNTREIPPSKQKVGHTDPRKKDTNGYSQKEVNIVKRIQNARTHYEILGLGPQATKDEINRAYRKLAFVIHPDKNAAPGSEEAFKALTAARRALLNSGLP